ncbi:UDP-glucose 4-epimerase GalE [Erysipelothrix inopinata]|uniref:UDP-glucose 4-epimerase n=1 Tax=Erysipelothrix inopinata TaxID=225084 RepID=A0A7G9RXD2_9FIRM|nr:UDP-glucose 4-epimerase GalE [Erysipelothrix inopinata]QNN60257.1 UDP-glucose 4-epimerase GalE [Erysipelothrix inopinata]
MKILVTGGAGYIGSHTCVELLNEGHEVVVVDDLSNSSETSLERVEKITGKKVIFEKLNILDREALDACFSRHDIDGVIHFAGFKAVGESVAKPIEYYHNNITGTLVLCDVMRAHNVKKIIFSSSATVYGSPKTVPITEDFPLSTTNPYGSTKLMLEQILQDIYISDPSWGVVILRYFNPIGAHESGIIGEDPKGIPNNLIPYVAQVAAGIREKVSVFGDDYDTYDGTGVRDYIHVVDLAKGHVAAMNKIMNENEVLIYNLGTGNGSSVLDIINTFRKVSGQEIPYEICDRRPGDIAICYADTEKAFKELGWKAHYNLEEMCAMSWNWQSNNPNGYDK